MAMYRYDEDEELARAIAASLNEDQPKPKPRTHSTVRHASMQTCAGIVLYTVIYFYTQNRGQKSKDSDCILS